MTAGQSAQIEALIARIDAAKAPAAVHHLGSRVRKLRAKLVAIRRMRDSLRAGQFLHEWAAGIESACLFLENSARPEFQREVAGLVARSPTCAGASRPPSTSPRGRLR